MRHRRLQCDAATVAAWSGLTLDHNPLHVDADYAETSPFGRIIVQGHLLAALAVDEVVRESPEVRRIAIRFAAPVAVGSSVRIRAEDDGEVVVVADPGGVSARVETG